MNISVAFSERRLITVFLTIIAVAMTFLALTAGGTGDEGDSIMHFLYAREAFKHPENFLDHWAKPVFVLFTAPIAQGGFTAMKLFNVAMLVSTLLLTWRTAKLLHIPNAWLTVVPVIFSIMTVSLTLSGLTEPMFAFWMMTGIYLFVKNHPLPAVVWLSFLPFVRSEGLVIFCVVILYLLVKKNWKLLPLLAVGHIFYAVVGWFHYRDLLWIFNKMSYAVPESAYGSGNLRHFYYNMPLVSGEFLSNFLWFSVLVGAVRMLLFWAGKVKFSKEEIWLVYGIGIAYFIAHSLFWYLGIFNSFGLMRVMIAVLPLYAVMTVQAVNFVINLLPAGVPYLRKSLPVLFTFAAAYSFFTTLNYSWHLELNNFQKTQEVLVQKYKDQYRGQTVYSDAVHPALGLDIDWFSAAERRSVRQLYYTEPKPERAIVIWDSWFAVEEARIPLEKLQEDKNLREIECVTINEAQSCLFAYTRPPGDPQVLYESGFEMPSGEKTADSLYAKSGKFSRLIGPAAPFLNTAEGRINTFHIYKNPSLKISFWAYLPADCRDCLSAKTVISFVSQGKNFAYYREPVFTETDKSGTWKYVEMTRPVPPHKTARDVAKVYIWNPGGGNIYADDVRTEWYYADK